MNKAICVCDTSSKGSKRVHEHQLKANDALRANARAGCVFVTARIGHEERSLTTASDLDVRIDWTVRRFYTPLTIVCTLKLFGLVPTYEELGGHELVEVQEDHIVHAPLLLVVR